MGKFYVTTSIPYVNAEPHIGHVLEFIQADVLARYHRRKGDDVFFLTGADEHGVKIVRAAEATGKTLQDFTSDITKKFKNLKKALN
ncbi:MAG: class I tRNA ligase family protein, partial [Candidatus Azambacteria bacterium]|nr:class I tRNA ligase family protein [Candidatus Azambacteria bacterium]